METNEQYSSNSSSISAGFLVGRRNSSVSLLLRSERKSFGKPKKQYRYQTFPFIFPVRFERSPLIQVKGVISSMPWHVVFAFLNPLLIGVIQVKCQGFSPFQTNPAEMWTFLLATLVYCFAFAANITWRRRALFSGQMALIFGFLSSISLFSIFLPTILGQLIFFLWIIFPFLVLRRFINWPFQWILKAISRLLSNIRKRFNIDGNVDHESPHPALVLV